MKNKLFQTFKNNYTKFTKIDVIYSFVFYNKRNSVAKKLTKNKMIIVGLVKSLKDIKLSLCCQNTCDDISA